jgi:hypothetical protein
MNFKKKEKRERERWGGREKEMRFIMLKLSFFVIANKTKY